MTTACVRCGFPNAETALHCRACAAPLNAGSDAVINTKLQKILAETRARTRARQRRGATMDPNRVDVVPRLPGGLATSDETLKKSLEKARAARREGLRDELRRAPNRGSIPSPQAAASAIEAATPTMVEPAAPETPVVSEMAPSPAAGAGKPPVADRPVAPVVTLLTRTEPERPAAAEAPHGAEPAARAVVEPLAKPSTQAPPAVAASTSVQDPSEPALAKPAPQNAARGSWPPPRGARRQEPTKQPKAARKPAASTASKGPGLGASIVASARSGLGLARRMLPQRAAASPAAAEQNLAVESTVDPLAHGLFGFRRLAAALVDGLPAMIAAGLFLRSQLVGAKQPPEEVVAAWLLGEASVGLGWLMPIVAWLLWSYIGLALWRATPGMRLLGLRWQDSARWRVFARPLLYIVSLLPLGLGGTVALVDRNSRGLADLLLGLRWQRQ